MSRRTNLFIMISLICLSHISHATSNKVVKISTGDWAPFISEKLPDKGCICKLITDCFESQGYSVDFQFFPWKRAYQSTVAGEYDASLFWYFDPQRENEVIFPKYYVTSEENYMYSLSKNKYEKLDQLDNNTIALNIGFTYDNNFMKELSDRKTNISYTKNIQQNLKLILNERVTYSIIEEKKAISEISKLKPDEGAYIQRNAVPVFTKKGFLVFSKADPSRQELVKIFEQGYLELMSKPDYYQNYLSSCAKAQAIQ